MPEGREKILEGVAGLSRTTVANDVNPADVLKEINYKALESLPDAIIVINRKGEIVVFNHQAELMFGYDRVEVFGKLIEVLIPEAIRNNHVASRNGYFNTPRVREMGTGMQLRGRDRYGNEFGVQISLSAMVVMGAGTHAMAVIRRVKEESNKNEDHA